MANVPKYEKVKSLILSDIRTGIYSPGERIPTREQLVEKYSVTRTTIGQALKILVNAGVLVTSKRGGTVVTGKSMPLNIALISTLKEADTSNLSHANDDCIWGILKPLFAMSSQYNLNFIDIKSLSPDDFSWSSEYNCMIWLMPNKKFLTNLKQYSDKVLVINRYRQELNFIATNHRQTVCEMTEYNLRKAGKNSQVFFLAPSEDNDFIHHERQEGFVDACQKANKFYRICDLSTSDYQSMFEDLMQIEFNKECNIVMVSPCRAYTGAVLQMAQRRGLTFGKNFFYSDFDNEYSLRNTGIKIVSAIQDYKKMGLELVKSLQHFGEKKIQVFVPCKIIK